MHNIQEELGALCFMMCAVYNMKVYVCMHNIQEELGALREELSGRDKEVREAKAAYREAQDEITRITDK